MSTLISKLFKSKQEYNQTETITIIISAYLRSDVLNRTLKSVYAQTHKNWKILIIADCCDEKFLSEVDLSHKQVELINLPVRSGAQYGPNSVGIHMAQTQYIAFLNHDDIWLSDHLEIGIKSLKKNSADFFLGKAAFCHSKHQKEACEQKGRLVFSELNYPNMIWRAVSGPNWIFEPASSWIVNTSFAKNIGYWNSPINIKGTSVMDWLQRCCLADAQFCFSDTISVLKINLHHGHGYKGKEICSKEVSEFINLSPQETRKLILNDLESTLSFGLMNRFSELNHKEEKKIKEKYHKFIKNNNIESTNMVNKNKTTEYAKIIKRRTGEDIKEFFEAEEIIKKMKLDNTL